MQLRRRCNGKGCNDLRNPTICNGRRYTARTDLTIPQSLPVRGDEVTRVATIEIRPSMPSDCHRRLAREDSRGASTARTSTDSELSSSTYNVVRQRGDAIELTREPVTFTRVKPGQTLIAEPAAA
jgi:hypothetical protein